MSMFSKILLFLREALQNLTCHTLFEQFSSVFYRQNCSVQHHAWFFIMPTNKHIPLHVRVKNILHAKCNCAFVFVVSGDELWTNDVNCHSDLQETVVLKTSFFFFFFRFSNLRTLLTSFCRDNKELLPHTFVSSPQTFQLIWVETENGSQLPRTTLNKLLWTSRNNWQIAQLLSRGCPGNKARMLTFHSTYITLPLDIRTLHYKRLQCGRIVRDLCGRGYHVRDR